MYILLGKKKDRMMDCAIQILVGQKVTLQILIGQRARYSKYLGERKV
jgi:hypothetical protein